MSTQAVYKENQTKTKKRVQKSTPPSPTTQPIYEINQV